MMNRETALFIYKIQLNRPAILTEGPTPEEEAIIDAHVNHLDRLTRAGVIVLAGRTQTKDKNTFGIVIFRAGSEEEARQIVNDDPGVAQGVWQAELFPFKIAFLGDLETELPGD